MEWNTRYENLLDQKQQENILFISSIYELKHKKWNLTHTIDPYEVNHNLKLDIRIQI